MSRCEIHVPIAPTPAFFGGVRLLAESVRRYGGDLGEWRLIVTVSRDCEPWDIGSAVGWSSDYPIEWRWVGHQLYEEFGIAATALQRFTYEIDAESVLMLDADTLCTGSLSDLLAGPGLRGVVAYVSPRSSLEFQGESPAEADFWAELFRFADLKPVPEICEHPGWGIVVHRQRERRFCPPYFNLGVLAAPSADITRLGASVFDELSTVNRYCEAIHRCQLALTLALARTGTEWTELPLRFNFPNRQVYWDTYPAEAADIRILHYMNRDEVDRDQFRASPGGIRALLEREDLSAVNRFLQSRIAGLGDSVLAQPGRPGCPVEGEEPAGVQPAERHSTRPTGPVPATGRRLRYRLIRPTIPEPDAWVELLAPAYAERWFSNHGPLVQRLERGLRGLTGPAGRDVAAVASGTSGLVAALLALEVQGPVALPAFTFPATAHAVRLAGCTPVFCDVEADSWELDPEAAADAIEERGCVALIHVRAFGLCRDTARIEAVAAEASVPLLIDSAAAFGGRLADGSPVGSSGSVEVFSFHATKPFGIGEGGAVAAPEPLAARIREVINFGLEGGVPKSAGLNAKMSEFTAAIGLAMLERFDAALASRADFAGRLADLLPAAIQGAAEPGLPPWQCMPLAVADSAVCAAAVEALAGAGVEARASYHPALHRTPAFETYADRPLEVTDDLAGRILCLPVYADLEPAELAGFETAVGAALEPAEARQMLAEGRASR